MKIKYFDKILKRMKAKLRKSRKTLLSIFLTRLYDSRNNKTDISDESKQRRHTIN